MHGQKYLPDAMEASLAEELLDIVNSSWKSQAICVAARLGIADILNHGPQTAETLASKVNCHPPSLHRLLNALASLGVLKCNDDHTFSLSQLGQSLRSDTHYSIRSWTVWWGRYLWPVWGNLFYSIRSGRCAGKLLSRENGFVSMEKDPDMSATFNEAMAELTCMLAPSILSQYNFAEVKHVLDIGGGNGELLAILLQAYPEMHGTLFDQPYALEAARNRLTDQSSSRCSFVTGNFLESVPECKDRIILKNILHDWDDAQCAVILNNCKRSMNREAKLLVLELVLEPASDVCPDQSAFHSDLNMLVALGGRERNLQQFETLLTGSGFRIEQVLLLHGNFKLIEAVLM